MAEAGIFIGWGANVPGREEKGLEVFNESVAYWGQLEEDGKIESFEVVLLTPHGGDLEGFALLRGSRDQVGTLIVDEEFERTTARATLIVQNVGIVPGGARRGPRPLDRDLPGGDRRSRLGLSAIRARFSACRRRCALLERPSGRAGRSSPRSSASR